MHFDLDTIKSLLEILLLLTTLGGALLGGSRWATTQRGQQALRISELLHQAAAFGVQATEQIYRKDPRAGLADAIFNQVKKDEAVARALGFLQEHGIEVDLARVGDAIEAYLHTLNQEKTNKA